MGRQGKNPLTVERRGKAREEAVLGKALQRRQARNIAEKREKAKYEKSENEISSSKYASILQSSSLEDFIASAMLMDKEFRSEKMNALLLDRNTGEEINIDSGTVVDRNDLDADPNSMDFEQLRVPRRPKWTEELSATEFDRLEKEAFTDWRREIAQLEEKKENLKVTPYEKNIEVWRQLWRVMEKSDILIQIVDARNPLFYYSRDLCAYASEFDPPKPMIMLVNKSDFLTPLQRNEWEEYFTQQGWKGLFFSAQRCQEELNNKERVSRGLNTIEISQKVEKHATTSEETSSSDGESELDDVIETKAKILNREELLYIIENYADTLKCEIQNTNKDQRRVCVGLIGFPNVGKSSIINVLAGVTPFSHDSTRVSVAATPGKTKHFQTIVLSPTLMLCDCPGLVFPSFVSSTAEMICAGVLPISQMRDFFLPIKLIAQRVPRHILELTYTIRIPDPPDWERSIEGEMRAPTSAELLSAICKARGYYRSGSKGDFDMLNASRMLLKDYTDGKLLFCHPPFDVGPSNISRFLKETEKLHLASSRMVAKLEDQALKAGVDLHARDIDGEELNLILKIREEAVEAKNAERDGPTRAEAGLKKWGKKSKKLREKEPYANWESKEDKNPTRIGFSHACGKKVNKKHLKQTIRREQLANVRTVYPHHPSYCGPV